MSARFFQGCIILLALAAAGTGAMAANAPAPLHNKTITISFSLTPQTAQASALGVQRVIYISSRGQIFVRSTRSASGASERKDVSVGVYQYAGGRITGVYTMANHANQIAISFDSSFQSCSATLQFGKSSGQPYKFTAPNGVTIVSDQPPLVSGISCSIQDGNPFL